MKKCLYLLATLLLTAACTGTTTFVDELPDIYPDYIGVTIPADIAPLNFNIPEDFDRVLVRVTGSQGGELKVKGRWASFPVQKWHRLTEQNAGGTLRFTVLGRKNGQWTQWRDFILYVSDVPLTSSSRVRSPCIFAANCWMRPTMISEKNSADATTRRS